MSTNSTKQNTEITENDRSQRKPIDLSRPIDFGSSSSSNEESSSSLEEVDVTPESDSESEKEDTESSEKTNDDEEEEEEEEEKESTEEDDEGVTLDLELGDVIKIKDPTNEILNNNTFIIDYIDDDLIKLINIEDLTLTTIKINEDGLLGDGNIESVSNIYRNDKKGYSRQNNLLPGTWINIYFGGDIPHILTGEITNLEQDMIEIKTYPDKEITYINFDYKGIPLNIPIDKIEIREKPSDESILTEDQEKVTRSSENAVDSYDQESVDIQPEFNIPTNVEVRDNIREFILKADEIQFGEELGAIQQYVNVDPEQRRFNVELQTNDLLDELLSDIPDRQRTNMVLTNIHTMIERFKQLREEFSTFDGHANVTGAIIKDASWKPLVHSLTSFKKSLYWILPVAKNVKKIYEKVGFYKEDEGYEFDEIENNISYKGSTRSEMHILEDMINSYKSNNLPDGGENKYVALYKTINPFFTPFDDVNPEMKKDVIIEEEVLDNFNVIIDTLGDLYSNVIHNKNLVSNRFVIDKYNLGLTRLKTTQISRNKNIYHLEDMTEPDTIALTSLVTLPEPVIRFSHISLPGTSIYTKANLNTVFVNYWKFLNNYTSVNKTLIDIYNDNDDEGNAKKLEENMEQDKNTFFSKITNFTMNKTEQSRDMSDSEIYVKFLEKVIPITRVLFGKIKKYINGKLSLKEVVEIMEPFLVYNSDLTFQQYKSISIFLQQKISEFNKKIIERSRYFSNLKRVGRGITNKPNATSLKMLINESENKQQVTDIYNKSVYRSDINSQLEMTNSELLKKMVMEDFGNVYNYCVALENTFLMLPENINKIIEDKESRIEQRIEKGSVADEKCENIIIAKQYANMEELEDDNDKTIFFDRKYDSTIYSILDDYLNDQMRMLPADFHEFLTKKLKEKVKLDEKGASYLAETLINGAKRVKTGDYAIYFDNAQNKLNYYIRDKNQWVLKENVDEKLVGQKQDMICNFQQNCISIQDKYDEKCQSMETNRRDLTKDAYLEIMNEFDYKYQMSKEDMQIRIQMKYDYYVGIIEKLDKLKQHRMLKYNDAQYKLGAKTGDEDVEEIIVSPYMKLLNIILGQNDFVKRQNDIITFKTKFTREADTLGGENEYWFYCIKTNTQLLPTFLYTIASVFVQNPDNYTLTVDRIIKDIGGLSDDGESWVDKKGQSGMVIRKIDFDIDEGYEDGFRVISRELLERDAGDIVAENIEAEQAITDDKSKSKIVNAETKLMLNIIHAMSDFMGINLDHQLEFILKITSAALLDALPSESEHNKESEAKAKRGQTIKPYKSFYNFNILYLTLASIMVGIQTSIPSVKTRRTFPGCVRSFGGYPIDGAGDTSGLQYMACIISQIPKAKSIDPWSALGTSKQDRIMTNIKFFIDNHLLKNIDVERKIKEKVEYLLLKPVHVIPVEHELNTWRQFLPPLVPIKMKTVENISPDFKASLLSDIKGASPRQREKILVIQSKIILFSLALQEKIQQIVEKKKLLLNNSSNDPYIENACCNEKGENITIDYFFKEDSEIGLYNSNVTELAYILDDVRAISKACFLFCRENSKNIYPGLTDKYSEETIYKAFITFCKFKSLIPIPDALMGLCGEKPAFSLGDSIGEQIRKLKNDSHNYTNEQFLRLLQVVNRHNIIQVSMNDRMKTRVSRMRDIIEKMSSLNMGDAKLVPLELRNHLDDVLDTFDLGVEEDTTEMRKLKNYLSESNSKMKNELISFMKQYSGVSKNSLKKMVENISNIMVWSENAKNDNIYDDTTYNSINYIKEYITNISNVYPNKILNKPEFAQNPGEVRIPFHWGLSEAHGFDIAKIIFKNYTELARFYDDKKIVNVLNSVIQHSKQFLLLVNETPYINEINYKNIHTISIFDKRTCKLLFENYLFTVFTSYIRYTDDDTLLIVGDSSAEQLEEPVSTLLLGDKKDLKMKIAQLLSAYINMMVEHKDMINMNYDEIMDVVYKIKEKEKDTFTDRLKGAMTDEPDQQREAREADTALKINKLGVWSKGLQKGLFAYDKDVYDEEREYMEQFAEIENVVKKKNRNNINDMNIQQYVDDYMEEQRNGEDIEREEYNMAKMTEDYMDGYIDGDEDQDVGLDD